MADDFVLGAMSFTNVNALDFSFGNVTDNVLLSINKLTGKFEKISPVDLVGKLVTEGNRTSIDLNTNKYVINVEFNTDNLTQIDTELKRIVGDS